MSWHDPTVDHPRAREAVAWVVETLRADGDIQGLLSVADATEAEGAIFQGRQRIGTTQSNGTPERFLVARERVDAGGRVQSFTGVDAVPFQVMAECRKTVANLEEWHQVVHERVFEALVGEKPDVETGSAASPIRRSRKPGRPMFDATDQTFYTTSTFRVTLRP
jgi:hypothetical protein